MRGKQFFFFRKKMKYNEIQSTVIECSLLECDGAVCHPPDVRIPTVTGEKFETLCFDILYTQCLDILSPNNVLREDLPKSVCFVKKMKPSVLFVCTDTFQLTANIFFGPTGVGFFCGVFFFPLKNEIEGRNFNLQTPWSYFCYLQLRRPPCSHQQTQNHWDRYIISRMRVLPLNQFTGWKLSWCLSALADWGFSNNK